MIKSVARKIKLVTQWLGLVAALLIIGMVILIFLGRQTIGQLDGLRPSIQSFIATNTGFQVNLGPISGEWPQLIPIIDIQGIELINVQQEHVLSLQGARADLDLFRSISLGTPIWRELAVDKLEINFVENALGHWRLKGFNGESDTDLNIILEPFIYSRLIRLKSVTINLHSYSGQTTQLFGKQMLIENDRDFHRAQLSLSVAKNDSPANLIIEAYGDPTDLASFYADGYLKFEELNFSESLKMLTRSLMPDLSQALDQSQIQTAGEIWLDFNPGGRLDYRGELSLSKVPLNWLDDDIPPASDIKTMLTGWHIPGKDWGARLQDLQFDIGSTKIEPINLMYSQQLGSNWQEFDVSINRIKLEPLSDLLFETQILPASAKETLKIIQPTGTVSSLSMGKNESGLYLSAHLDGCNVLEFKGIPGLKDLNGYLELRDSKGLFHIADNDGFEIFFPKTYRDYLKINQAKGTIYFNWQSKDQLLVHTDIIKTKLEAGESQLKFTLERPRGTKQGAADFNLLIGASDLDFSFTQTYLPFTMPERSSKWMRNAIKSGNLKEFGMLYRASPPANNPMSRTMQLLFDTERASIKFNPNWPAFNNLEGLFLVDSSNLSAQIKSAKFGEAEVSQTRIEYSVKPPIEERKWIIDGQLDADLPAMIDILIHSPLNKKLGAMANWDYIGDTSTQVYLEIPSYIPPQGPAPTTNYKVTSVIEKGEMAVAGSPVEFKDMNGIIEFTPEKGIFSDNLNAFLWDMPFSAKLYREKLQKLSFSSALEPKSLNNFVDFPWQGVISNAIPITGSLYKDPNNLSKTTLEIKSDMKNVAINLPPPLGKSIQQSQQLGIKLHFQPTISQLEGKLGQHLLADIRFEQKKLKRGIISYDNPLVMPEQDMLLISANLPTIDFKLWQPLNDLIERRPKTVNSVETVFDFELDQWTFSGFKLSDISARIKPVTEGFDAVFTSDLADGSVSLFRDSDQPPKVALNRLALSQSLGANSVNLDPRLLVATDFSVDWLTVEDRNLGSLSFELRPEPSGASFNNISGNIFGLLPGVYSAEAPTEFFWGYDGQKHISKLVGPIGINNVGDLFAIFELPQVLDSQSGRLDSDLTWQGEPWAINKENLSGKLKIRLSDGNFYRTPTGAGAALKLIGLFNFANWLRRLQLDFSDVVGQNLAYNRLDGALNFENSVLSLDDPLKIKMPSGRMSMAGNFDLMHETVDAQLVATLPVATNLPWLVGITGGLPAALGVFVTSKLVEEQVNRISSISYKLSGSWDDVDVAVDKIFAADLPESSQSSDR